jgi:DNA-binding response OmpR family regulator
VGAENPAPDTHSVSGRDTGLENPFMNLTHRLLLADEDPACRTLLTENLTADGYTVDIASNCEEAVGYLRRSTPDLVLVDVKGATLKLVDWVRGGDDALGACVTDTPIVVASSHSSEIERVRLLDRGADDVITKPCSYPELRARIAAILRRTQPRQARPVTFAGPVRIDHHAHAVQVNGKPIPLSAIEYRLLTRLAEDPTRVFTRQELMRDVWGYECGAQTRTLDSHAHRLRRRLACDTPLVVNLRGIGYRLMSVT